MYLNGLSGTTRETHAGLKVRPNVYRLSGTKRDEERVRFDSSVLLPQQGERQFGAWRSWKWMYYQCAPFKCPASHKSVCLFYIRCVRLVVSLPLGITVMSPSFVVPLSDQYVHIALPPSSLRSSGAHFLSATCAS